MQALHETLSAIMGQLEQLNRDMCDLKQRAARQSQDSVWDVNMLRQEMVTKDNLYNLGCALVSRQDLARMIDKVCRRISALRFESHQEHQELLRFMDEGPYGIAAPGTAPSEALDTEPPGPHQHERSATLTLGEVLEIEDVGAVVEPSAPQVTLVRSAVGQGG